VVVTNPDTQFSIQVVNFTYVPLLTVTAITPTFGALAGGTSVTITGSGFLTGATVTIGGVPATGVTVGSATSITATTPVGTAGAKNVVVTNPDAKVGTLAGGFYYSDLAAPTVASILPIKGPLAGGTAVTITGTGFLTGATVTIGGTPATSVTWVSATSIAAVTPAGTVGAKPVVVTNPDTQFSVEVVNFTYEIVVVPGFDINVAVQDIWDEVTNIEAKLDMHGHFYTFVDDWFGTIEGYVQVINWADITAIKDELANTTYGLEAIKNAIGTGGGGVAKANDTDVPIVRNSQTAGVIIPVDTEAFWGQLTVESTGTGYHIDVWDGDGWATVVGNGQRVQSISVSGFGLRLYNGTRSDITVDYVFVYHSAP
jgi:hypothetical protein